MMYYSKLKKSLFFLSILFVQSTTSLFAQQNKALIKGHLSTEQVKNKWLPGDIKDWIVSDQYTDVSTGLNHTYIQQRHARIPVYNGISVFVIKGDEVLYFKSGIIDHLENRVNSEIPSITPESAIKLTLLHLGKNEPVSIRQSKANNELKKFEFESMDVALSPILVQLVYREAKSNVLLAWDVSMDMKGESHWWNVRVDALTGAIIDKNDYTVECNFDNPVEELFSGNTFDSEKESSEILEVVTVADYNAFAYPLEAPNVGNRTLLADPSDAIASPFGWHDVDGIAGAEYTITRGNNVNVYEDANADNLPGYSPDGGPALHFDFPYATNTVPLLNRDAALTNLFYNNNAIHDFVYRLGFTETAGNFQQNNYGRGGQDNDFVKAEGLDGGGTNNANFSTPPDGSSGKMQMYLWTGSGAACTNLTISSAFFSGSMVVGAAEFSAYGTVTDTIILVNDSVGTFTDACSVIKNNIAGKIVLIDRGTCTSISKAQAAITAGAVGVIIANNTGTAPLVMAGTPQLTVPVLSVSLPDGNTLKSALLAGTVVATINTCLNNQIDGAFDNGIVAHEFGHGLSNRLTGGPSQASCLGNSEQGGEGWSDWLALIMTIRPGDQGSNARGIGTFAKGQLSNGPGIRRFPYSTNMSINPQTYAGVAVSSGPHAIGEIWCDAIWDMSWFLIDQYGFNSNLAVTTSGNYIATRLVLEGMKLQPCSPGFLDARDAILMADALLYNNAHRCLLWSAFARRGMGFDALQGSNAAGDETEGFSLPPYCLPATQPPVAAFVSDVSALKCGGKVRFTDQSVQAFDWKWNFGDQTTSTLQSPVHTYTTPGTYNVKLVITNPLGSDSVVHAITVTPAFTANVSASPIVFCSGDSVQLSATASGSTYNSYLLSAIPFAPLNGTANDSLVTLNDDVVSAVKPIGFTFNFFGQNYTNFYISSNGLITFNANTPAQPVYGEFIPSTSNPNNYIAMAWNDLNPQNAGSSIRYFNTGIAPNRKLVVKYTTSHFGGTSYPFVVQGILYEGSNVIEIHTTTISDASAFDSDARTTQGVENADGSQGVPVPGRNSAIFSASNDAYRFTPYIPYAYAWQAGNLNGPAQTVYPVATGTYNVQVTDGTPCVATFSTPVITLSPCSSFTFNLKVFIGGMYNGNGEMVPLLFNVGFSTDPTACDSIIVELHHDVLTDSIVASVKTLLHKNGTASIILPGALYNHSYFVAIRHRNTIETWSKSPVLFNAPVFSFDFTSP